MERSPFKHITVRLPRHLDRWLRIRAAELDVSKSALIRSILLTAADGDSDKASEGTAQSRRAPDSGATKLTPQRDTTAGVSAA
jgi:hypothetical protein